MNLCESCGHVVKHTQSQLQDSRTYDDDLASEYSSLASLESNGCSNKSHTSLLSRP